MIENNENIDMSNKNAISIKFNNKKNSYDLKTIMI